MFGFEKLIEELLKFGKELLPWEVIPHYDKGVRLRLGKAVRDKKTGIVKVLEPGFHWRLPLYIDDFHTHMVKPTTMDLSEQTITTKDEKAVVVRGVLKYDVYDVATLLLESDGPAAAVADMSMGIIKDAFMERDWLECLDPKFPKQIAIKIRNEAKKWGINVLELTFTDLAIIKTFRLLNSYSSKNI